MNLNPKKQPQLSVVIPTFNEEGNIKPLIERIHDALSKNSIAYEIIFVDDFSLDNTRTVIHSFQKKFPVSLYLKKGVKHSKAHSLLEGFTYTKADIIAMIDADLQYPPEALPKMVKKINQGFDVIVANRKQQNISLLRKILHWGFYAIFSKLLHNLTVDSQSGLKVFRAIVSQQVKINPSPWTFDMEFLIKAQKAGFTISSVDIKFDDRVFGKSKVNPLKATWEIGFSAIKLKFAQNDPIYLRTETI